MAEIEKYRLHLEKVKTRCKERNLIDEIFRNKGKKGLTNRTKKGIIITQK